ncbi:MULTISPECIES: class II aldolase/adducin family protein [Geobacter]|uniref:class II aldolase/adducin family protein n=1 Tax=Geobacter TaxID=28231 RepID=UPI0025738F7B|nr:class II aldolase/adducin family protein [Geobacter sulfurreducens]BEH09825.1 class II aldolase/adducin family protein [Geobacter sulfurreducens subsp. ethanolicus]BET57721.1 class II aldolase/adducin family protein [Geobacter sp. 60473]
MRDQVSVYTNKLIADRSALAQGIAIAAQDDVLIAEGAPDLARLAGDVLSRLTCLGMVVARPSLPFADFLVARARAGESCIVPRDTETRTFLHDIPFLRRSDLGADPAPVIARLLGSRKGVVVEGVGIVASGALTVEQAYINYSSVFHSTFVKYLQDVLHHGFILPGEAEAFAAFRSQWLRPLTHEGLTFRPGPLAERDEILDEIATVGRYTVERGLVDSFFGNISCRAGEVIYISQTAASLDSLAGCIDPVPTDNSSTFGITASSELLAHRRIYEATGAATILHGHPKFAVIMSMECAEEGCAITDCWKECDRVRFLGDTPVVAGEIGAGGLARRVPPAIAGPRKAVVYGHGVFTVGETDFADAFRAMVAVENWCRGEYFRRLEERLG